MYFFFIKIGIQITFINQRTNANRIVHKMAIDQVWVFGQHGGTLRADRQTETGTLMGVVVVVQRRRTLNEDVVFFGHRFIVLGFVLDF